MNTLVKLTEMQTFLYAPRNSVLYWLLLGACIALTAFMPVLGIPFFIIYMIVMFVVLRNKRIAFWQKRNQTQSS